MGQTQQTSSDNNTQQWLQFWPQHGLCCSRLESFDQRVILGRQRARDLPGHSQIYLWLSDQMKSDFTADTWRRWSLHRQTPRFFQPRKQRLTHRKHQILPPDKYPPFREVSRIKLPVRARTFCQQSCFIALKRRELYTPDSLYMQTQKHTLA